MWYSSCILLSFFDISCCPTPGPYPPVKASTPLDQLGHWVSSYRLGFFRFRELWIIQNKSKGCLIEDLQGCFWSFASKTSSRCYQMWHVVFWRLVSIQNVIPRLLTPYRLPKCDTSSLVLTSLANDIRSDALSTSQGSTPTSYLHRRPDAHLPKDAKRRES